jgi:hypothetical protein
MEEELVNIISINRRIYFANEKRFLKMFHWSLRTFWHVHTGFDVIKFDKEIRTPSGKSTYIWAMEKYGDEAADIMRDLIAIDKYRNMTDKDIQKCLTN